MSLNELEAVLEAGTYTNFGVTPPVGAYEQPRVRGQYGLMVYKKNSDAITLMNGTLLLDNQEGYVHGWDRRTKTNRENLLKDAVKILEDSTEPLDFVNIERYDGSPAGKRMHSFRIEIKRVKEFY